MLVDQNARSAWSYCYSLYGRAETLATEGELVAARAAYQDAFNRLVVLVETETGIGDKIPELSLILQKAGDALACKGYTEAALEIFRQELSLRRFVLDRDPKDRQKQQHAAQAVRRVGDLLVQRSIILRALERTASEDAQQTAIPQNFIAVAKTLEAQGDLVGALALYREELDVRRKQLAKSPENTDALLGLSWTLGTIGNVLRGLRDLAGAFESITEAVTIRGNLLTGDPENPKKQLDLSWSLMALGETFEDQSDPVRALDAYRQALAIRQALAQADPTNDGLRCDVVVSLVRSASMFEASGDPARAAALYHEARGLLDLLSTKDPAAHWQAEIAQLDELICAIS
jgi:tetratricopeptide (TPR) repeat protein